MPIKRYFLPNNRPSHFHVVEEFEVYEGSTALALDHFLNHLKVLLHGGGSQDQIDNMVGLPQYAKYENFEEDIQEILLKECIVLLQYTAKIADFYISNEHRDALLEEMKAKVPFLDFRYPRDSFPPAAEESD